MEVTSILLCVLKVCGARQRAMTMASPPLELMVAVADLVTVVEREASAAAAIQVRRHLHNSNN